MTLLEMQTRTGGMASLNVPEPGIFQSVIVFAYPKSGSVMLDNIVSTICAMKNVPSLAIPVDLFTQGFAPRDVEFDLGTLFRPRGVVYRGHRDYPYEFQIDKLEKYKKILLVRDPRDMLVSLYFSWAASHGKPVQDGGSQNAMLDEMRAAALAKSIDEFCLEQARDMYMAQFDRYTPHMKRGVWRIYRYKDVIFKKPQFVRAIAAEFGVALNDAEVREIVDLVDIVPDAEDPSNHIRQVSPGDHLVKLKPETIAELDKILSPFLLAYGYRRRTLGEWLSLAPGPYPVCTVPD